NVVEISRFQRQTERAVHRHIGRLRFRSKGQRQRACHCESDHFLIHRVSPLSIKFGKKSAPARNKPSQVSEKLARFCQTAQVLGKLNLGQARVRTKSPESPVA